MDENESNTGKTNKLNIQLTFRLHPWTNNNKLFSEQREIQRTKNRIQDIPKGQDFYITVIDLFPEEKEGK